jgi:hypothetical protein
MTQETDRAGVPLTELAKLVRQYTRLCQPGVEDETIRERLIAEGIAPEMAFQVTVFTPIAFTHYVLHRNVNFSPTYIVMDPETYDAQEYRLEDHPIYEAAYTLAPELRETFRFVAVRSAEMDAVNNLLKTGKQLNELKDYTISPPVIMTLYPMYEWAD